MVFRDVAHRDGSPVAVCDRVTEVPFSLKDAM
jgi:hypothetical protein